MNKIQHFYIDHLILNLCDITGNVHHYLSLTKSASDDRLSDLQDYYAKIQDNDKRKKQIETDIKAIKEKTFEFLRLNDSAIAVYTAWGLTHKEAITTLRKGKKEAEDILTRTLLDQ